MVLKKDIFVSLGKQLKDIGSLHFLGYIFSRAQLKAHMSVIRKNSFKWNGFIDGLKSGFEKEVKSDQFFQELPGFAALVKIDYKLLLEKAKEGNCETFVSCLLQFSQEETLLLEKLQDQ